MKHTENFIRSRARHQIFQLIDELKKDVEQRVFAELLEGLLNRQEGIELDFYFKHHLGQDITVIINEEIAAILNKPTQRVQGSPKTKRAL